MRDRSGRWQTIAALPPELGSSADVAAVLVVSPARAEERFARLAAAYDLTPRERQVVELISRGFSTGDIASRLCLTPYTVQDHLKHVFEKMNVSSRRELMARLFHHGSAIGRAFDPARRA